ILERQGVARPIDLPFDRSGVEPLGARHRHAEPARTPAHTGRRQLGLTGKLQALADVELTLEARLQQVSLESQLHRPTRRVALLDAGSERGIEGEPLAADREAAAARDLTLAPSRQLRLDVADRLPATIRRRDVKRAAANGERIEAHGGELL